MTGEFINGIIVNAVFLIGLAVTYNFLPKEKKKFQYLYQVIIGIILAYLVINVMRFTVEIDEGVIIDTRSILVSLTALFFGPIAAIIVLITGVSYRWFVIGGVGALPGVMLFFTATATGLLFRKYRFKYLSKGFFRRSLEFTVFAYVVHIVMISLFTLLPTDNKFDLMRDMVPFILVVLPIISFSISTLIYVVYENYNKNKQLIASQDKFVKAIEDAPVPISIHNDQGKIITYNKAWTKSTGYTIKNASNIQIWAEKAFKEQAIEALRVMTEFGDLEDEIYKKEVQFYTSKNRKVTWDFHTSIIGAQPDSGKLFMSIARDVTEKKKLEQELINLSFKDRLTGLYNRRFFEEELERLNVQRNYPMTLVFVDVNSLKLTNDAFGHDQGDKLLQLSSTVFRDTFRADDIIARVGGDEFVVILPRTNEAIANQLIERVQENLHGKKIKNIQVSLAIGKYTSISSKLSIARAYKLAEEDMYNHKLQTSKAVKENAINVILNTLFRRDRRQKLHALEVSDLCEQMGNILEMDESSVKILKKAGYLHDIGKIVVPKEVLKKKTAFSDIDHLEMRKHPETGYRILNNGYNLTAYASIILDHHERWDGAGYPQKKRGKDVLIESRIIAICDAFSTMTSLDSYKTKRYSIQEGIDELLRHSGTQFDPDLVTTFIEQIAKKL